MAALLAVGGAYAIASFDWCGKWEAGPPLLVEGAWSKAPLNAGSAREEISVPWPVTVAGYGPRDRSQASRANHPVAAQALVLEAGGLTVALVGIDLLEVPQVMVEKIRSGAGLDHTLVFATHAHSSLGGFDERPLAQLAGVGSYLPRDANAVIDAAVKAVKNARAAMKPAQLASASGSEDWCWARSGTGCDKRVDRLAVTALDGSTIGELWMMAGHPTLVPRRVETLDPDYPGIAALDRLDAGVTLVAQSLGGNAHAGTENATQFAKKVEDVFTRLPLSEPRTEVSLGLARVKVPLPHPDGSRLVPSISRAMATNFVCVSADREAEVWALALGDRTLLSVPVEPSYPSGLQLEEAAQANRVLSLANGYLGYVETKEDAEGTKGESKRQYYTPQMFEQLRLGAALAGTAVRAGHR
ncbi:MAG: hypothetical protein QM723_30835 [Myxococcaceae bacterium]